MRFPLRLQAIRQRKFFQWTVAYAAAAWVALQVLQFLAGTYAWPPVVLRVVPIIMAAGLFIVFVLAWYHGERGRQRVSAGEAVLLLVIVLAGSASAYIVAGAAPASRRGDSATAVAVLPFENLSANQENAYFAAGIHGELLTQLAQLGGLRVISRTSVMAYADTRKTLKQIGDELGVASILEASVQRAGNRVRVEAQLIDVASESHLWAGRYDRDVTDVFSIQTDIAQQIATALHMNLTRSERAMLDRRPTANADAYDAYLRGSQYLDRPTYSFSDLATAQRLFERAIALDPDFADAHARLASTHARIRRWGYDRAPARLEATLREAQRALELQPKLPEAHFAMGLYHYFGLDDFDAALEEFKEAMRLAPSNSQYVRFIGLIYRRQGRWPEALEYVERAMQLNPRDPAAWGDLAETSLVMRRYADADRAYNRAQELAPDVYDGASSKGWLYVSWRGELDTLRAISHRSTYAASNVASQQLDRFLLGMWERNGQEALAAAQAADSIIDLYNYYYPRSMLIGLAYELLADTVRARAAFADARKTIEAALHKDTTDLRFHEAHGRVMAGLGLKAEAARRAAKLADVGTRTNDKYIAQSYLQSAAEIRARIGDADGAFELIPALLNHPSYLDVNNLRLNPVWDPIRADKRFLALMR